jgi:hypothetical protein
MFGSGETGSCNSWIFRFVCHVLVSLRWIIGHCIFPSGLVHSGESRQSRSPAGTGPTRSPVRPPHLRARQLNPRWDHQSSSQAKYPGSPACER